MFIATGRSFAAFDAAAFVPTALLGVDQSVTLLASFQWRVSEWLAELASMRKARLLGISVPLHSMKFSQLLQLISHFTFV